MGTSLHSKEAQTFLSVKQTGLKAGKHVYPPFDTILLLYMEIPLCNFVKKQYWMLTSSIDDDNLYCVDNSRLRL